MKYLDNEEKGLEEAIASLDTADLQKPSEQFRNTLASSAQRFIQKETKMNIRMDPLEMQKIREMAAQEGLKYQTYVKSILHKYITGQLIEKKHMRD